MDELECSARSSDALSSGVHVIALGFTDEFLLLDPSVLEPDGNLALGEVGGGGDASPLVFGDELAGCVLLLQLLQLDLGVRDALFTPTPVAADLRLQWHDICVGGKRDARETIRPGRRRKHIAMFHCSALQLSLVLAGTKFQYNLIFKVEPLLSLCVCVCVLVQFLIQEIMGFIPGHTEAEWLVLLPHGHSMWGLRVLPCFRRFP